MHSMVIRLSLAGHILASGSVDQSVRFWVRPRPDGNAESAIVDLLMILVVVSCIIILRIPTLELSMSSFDYLFYNKRSYLGFSVSNFPLFVPSYLQFMTVKK